MNAIAAEHTTRLDSPGLANLGVVHLNLPEATLIEAALRRGEGSLAASGALVVKTGDRTGRSPKDKFIVENDESRERVAWGKVNRAMSADRFSALLARAEAYLQGREVFVVDAYANADPEQRLPLRVISERAWQALFARQLFRRPGGEQLRYNLPAYTVLSVPGFHAVPEIDGTNSKVAVVVDFQRRLVLIAGTEYAGEMKKSIFTVLNYILPLRNVLSMHCSANVGPQDDVALFFGLSGTGKTSLSADPTRRLIGDDEHGWSDAGVFNFEGGCYAKCIRLSRTFEPQIWDAIRFGAVVENVVMDPLTRQVDYDDETITENTRVAYPLEFIDNAVPEGRGGQPVAVLFLTADAFGVLPPISRLTPEQAMYHFLSGYTAKLAGTEAGLGRDPEATFSTCFGAPFLPLDPTTYANMLGERIARYRARCYLVNTGWTGGPFGIGNRININYTRAMVRGAISGQLDAVETWIDPVFGLRVPVHCADVPDAVLRPRETWTSPEDYDHQARDLAERFRQNFQQFDSAPAEVVAAGPRA